MTPPLPVQPYYDFAVSNLLPKQQTLSRFKQSAQVTLSIINKSNAEATFQLLGLGKTSACLIEFELPSETTVRQAEVTLAAGETIAIPVHIMLPASPVIALQRQRHYFTITTTLPVKQYASRVIMGQIDRSPLIGPWLMLLFIILMACPATLLARSLYTFLSPTETQVTLSNQATATVSSELIIQPPQAQSPLQLPEPETEVETKRTYQQMFEEIAQQYDLDWHLLAEIAYQESRFDPWAFGQAHEMGLMQIHPVTWHAWAPQVGVYDPYDPYSNVQVSAAYLAYLKKYTEDKGYPGQHWMLVGYNWGPNNLRKLFEQGSDWGQVPQRPRQYALKILQLGPEVPLRRKTELETTVDPRY